jgi:hypothetical protein
MIDDDEGGHPTENKYWFEKGEALTRDAPEDIMDIGHLQDQKSESESCHDVKWHVEAKGTLRKAPCRTGRRSGHACTGNSPGITCVKVQRRARDVVCVYAM